MLNKKTLVKEIETHIKMYKDFTEREEKDYLRISFQGSVIALETILRLINNGHFDIGRGGKPNCNMKSSRPEVEEIV